MLKHFLIKAASKISDFISHIWHNFYFHWQLKDKTPYIVLGAFLVVITSIPT